jgi:hypothetical protein
MSAIQPTDFEPGTLGSYLPGPVEPFGPWDVARRFFTRGCVVGRTEAQKFSERFLQLTSRWTFDRRELLFEAIQSLTLAERARSPKSTGTKTRRNYLLHQARGAARLAKSLDKELSSSMSMGPLICDLCDFAISSYSEAAMSPSFQMNHARHKLAAFRAEVGADAISNAHLTALILLLLGGGGARFDESRLRKQYLNERAALRVRKGMRGDASTMMGVAEIRERWKRARQEHPFEPATPGEPDYARIAHAYLNLESDQPSTSPSSPSDARAFRAQLTSLFKVRLIEGPRILMAEIRDQITEHLGGLEKGEREALESAIRKAGPKPSNAAARITAKKFQLSFRVARSGRAPHGSVDVPRTRSGRRVIPVGNLDKIEHFIAAHRRGRSSRRAW